MEVSLWNSSNRHTLDSRKTLKKNSKESAPPENRSPLVVPTLVSPLTIQKIKIFQQTLQQTTATANSQLDNLPLSSLTKAYQCFGAFKAFGRICNRRCW